MIPQMTVAADLTHREEWLSLKPEDTNRGDPRLQGPDGGCKGTRRPFKSETAKEQRTVSLQNNPSSVGQAMRLRQYHAPSRASACTHLLRA